MKEKYTNNIAYLFKRITTDNTPVWEQEGTPFRCNIIETRKQRNEAMVGTFKESVETSYYTTTQLNFAKDDKVAFVKVPEDDLEYSTISEVLKKPYLEQGNKYRTKQYWDFRIIIG